MLVIKIDLFKFYVLVLQVRRREGCVSHRWPPLDLVTRIKPPRIATPTVQGRSHFADMYIKKIHNWVPKFVQVEIWATLFILRDWRTERSSSLDREIAAMMLQDMLALQLRFSLLPRIVGFEAAANDRELA